MFNVVIDSKNPALLPILPQVWRSAFLLIRRSKYSVMLSKLHSYRLHFRRFCRNFWPLENRGRWIKIELNFLSNHTKTCLLQRKKFKVEGIPESPLWGFNWRLQADFWNLHCSSVYLYHVVLLVRMLFARLLMACLLIIHRLKNKK